MTSCDVVQWRRIRRKVLVEGKPIDLVAMQESLTAEATRTLLSQRPAPSTNVSHRVALFSAVIPYTGLVRGDRELLQWSQWLYALEQDELAYPPLGAELSRHGPAARKRMLAVLATEEGFGLKAIARHLGVSHNTVSGCARTLAGAELRFGRAGAEPKSASRALLYPMAPIQEERDAMESTTTTTYPIRSSNAAYPDIHSITIAIAGVATALEYRGGGSAAYNAGDYLTFEARAVRLEVRLPLYGPIEAALIAQRPDVIELTAVPSGQPAPAHPRQVTGLGQFFDSLVQPRLVSYFQRERDRLVQTATQDRTKWPNSWQMAWAVRNAVSHGGVAFEKPTQKPVSWRGITFGPADEPARSLTTMLNGGDLILLMLDMAADLP